MTAVNLIPISFNTKSTIKVDLGPYEFTDKNDWLGLVQDDPEPY